MTDQQSSMPTPQPATPSDHHENFFHIIDETGEGFGFELTPEALAKPLAIGTSAMFGIGMLAGVPLGLFMGRADEGQGKRLKSAKPIPTFEGLKFAATTFGLGTLLCGAMGVAGFYGLKSYFQVDSFQQFGQAMRKAVPERRSEMEKGLAPILDTLRRNAGDNLPQPMRRLQQRFLSTRFGKWIKNQVDMSVIVKDESQPEKAEVAVVNSHSSTS